MEKQADFKFTIQKVGIWTFYIKAKLKRQPNEYTLVFYNVLIGGTLGPVGPQESLGKA